MSTVNTQTAIEFLQLRNQGVEIPEALTKLGLDKSQIKEISLAVNSLIHIESVHTESGKRAGVSKRKIEQVRSQLRGIIPLLKRGYTMDKIIESYNFDMQRCELSLALKAQGYSINKLKKEGLLEDLAEVEQGREHLFRVRMKHGYTPTSFYGTLANLGKRDIFNQEVPLSRFHRYDLEKALEAEGNSELNGMIFEGKDIMEIAEVQKATRQFVDMYIRGAGLHTIWEEARKKVKRQEQGIDLNEERQKIINTLAQAVEQRTLIYEGDSVDTKVEKSLGRIVLAKHNQGTPFANYDKLTSLLRNYFNAKADGEKLTFRELATKAGYKHEATANYHLKRLGISSMYWDSKRLTDKELELINRAKRTPFSNADLLYFGGLNCCMITISKHLKKEKSTRLPIYIQQKGFAKGLVQGLRYSELSQIYEAQDRGFTREELPVLFPDLKQEGIDRALAERQTHEQVIVQGLRILHPNREIDKPYTNPSTIGMETQ